MIATALRKFIFSIVFYDLLFRSSFWYSLIDRTQSEIVDNILIIHTEHTNQLLKGIFL
jgi:hypothetical protein